MKNNRFASNQLNISNQIRTRELNMQKFVDASTESDGVLVHILNFFGIPVAPHDFQAMPFWPSDDKIMLLREEIANQKQTPEYHQTLMHCVECYSRGEEMQEMVAEYSRPFEEISILDLSEEIDGIILLLKTFSWKLDDTFASHHRNYRRLTSLFPDSLRASRDDKPYIVSLKRVLNGLNHG